MGAIIVTGDDVSLPTTLKKDNATFTIAPSATVKASIVSKDRSTILIPAATVLEATTGSDWANSLIIVQFTSAETNAVTDYTIADLEIQVDDSGKLTWFTSVEIQRGTIDQ